MTDLLYSVANQVVIVSGGSRGIGKAIAKGFSARGANVIVTGRDEKTLVATADDISGDEPVVPIVCDVADPRAIASLVRQVCARFDRVDTLVNVAGVNRRKPAVDVTEDDYDFVLGINLKGAFLLAQAVGKQMIEQGGGSIINIESLNSDRPAEKRLALRREQGGDEQHDEGIGNRMGRIWRAC